MWLKYVTLFLVVLSPVEVTSGDSLFQKQRPLSTPKAPLADRVIITPELQKYVNQFMKTWRIPGLSLGIVKPDGSIETEGFGVMNDDGDPVTEDTLFYIASCSKAFLSASMALLIDDFKNGRNTTALPRRLASIGWSTKVKDILPEDWKTVDPWISEKASLLDILSHVSGFPNHDLSYDLSASPGYLLRNLRNLKSLYELRELFQYSNMMYIIGSHIITKYTGNYTEFVQKRILGPAGMSASTYYRESAKSSGLLSEGYDALTNRSIPSMLNSETEALLAGAGGLISSAKDMTRWLKVLISQGVNTGSNVSVIPRHSLEAVTTGRSIAAPRPSSNILSIPVYAMGWIQDSYRGHNRIWHNGGVPGFSTFLCYYPDDNLGIFMSFNVFNTPGIEQLVPLKITDAVLGLDSLFSTSPSAIDIQSSQAVFPMMNFHTQERNLSSISQIALTGRPFKPLAGRYSNPGYGTLDLCNLASSNNPSVCNKARADFASINITTGLAAYWPRVWTSHIYAAPFAKSTFEFVYITIYPKGYGVNNTAFWSTLGSGFAIFVQGDDVPVGMGFYESPSQLPRENLTLERVSESSIAWFDWEPLPM